MTQPGNSATCLFGRAIRDCCDAGRFISQQVTNERMPQQVCLAKL